MDGWMNGVEGLRCVFDLLLPCRDWSSHKTRPVRLRQIEQRFVLVLHSHTHQTINKHWFYGQEGCQPGHDDEDNKIQSHLIGFVW